MPRLVSRRPRAAALLAVGLVAALPAQIADPLAFFETRVRPVLAERCVSCHGSKTQKSELRLDHGSFVRRGGARGPVVVPGDAAASRLVAAVRYEDVDLQMPPKGRLADAEIAALEQWIELGAPWPDEPVPEAAAAEPAFDLAARRAAHWCWQPRARPAVPSVRDLSWPADPIDLFVLAALEDRGLRPARDADPATWLRRVTFDLTGLPPTARELDAFLADPASDARARAVDRLLASPHFGERWARHWLDLVRYAETLGHEYDFEIPNAWHYRDYVVRALNADVPYDRFVQEHVAGDLLAASPEFGPRLHPDGFDESPIGTCFWWFGDQTHSPLDPRQHRADRVDNQIDVFGKTFLGLTVACARCHDHKFDAIAQRDYYALAGVVKSSRYALTPLLPPGGHRDALGALAELRPALVERVRASWLRRAPSVAAYLRAAATLGERPRRARGETDEAWRARQAAYDDSVAEAARVAGLESRRLRAFHAALPTALRDDRGHPFQAWACYLHDPEGWPARWRELRADCRPVDARPTDAVVLADFRHDGYDRAFVAGEAFGDRPRARDLVAVDGDGRPVVRARTGRVATSAVESLRVQGSLATRTFTIDRRYLWIEAAGEGTRINVVVEGFNVIRDPIYGPLKLVLATERMRLHRIDLSLWQGMQAYLQVHDLRTADPSDENDYGRPGWVAVRRVWLSDRAEELDSRVRPACVELLGDRELTGDELASAYARAVEAAVAAWQPDEPDPPAERADLLAFLSRHRLLDDTHDDPFLRLVRGVDSAIAEAACVPAMADGDGLDEHVFVRGDHRAPGEVVPRAGLTALDSDPDAFRAGSGRLALARELTRPDHPLVPRVLVNRVWHHLFGRGLVPTVDNFGVLGEPPSHPELLDWLAGTFVDDGWSLKRLLRRIVLSRTYAMASVHDDPRAAEVDPDLALLHRARVRRLDGEALRDALLVLAGRLDRKLGGASVPVHLTPFLDGRGRPERSGPLDGAGRRSLYQEVRRNFLNPWFLAFDTPVPFSTVGRRNVSNVPAQALALMNDPFVVEQARRFAERMLRAGLPDRGARVAAMLREAWGRAPERAELDAAEQFLLDQAQVHRADLDDVAPWADLAHALVNVKEFAFLR